MIENVVSLNPTNCTAKWQHNAEDLARELDWCERMIELRMQAHQKLPNEIQALETIVAPDLSRSRSPFADFVISQSLTKEERLALALAMLPSVRPRILDWFLTINPRTNRPFTEFGCVEMDGMIYATMETLAFVIGGEHLGQRIGIQYLLLGQKQRPIQRILGLPSDESDALSMRAPLRLDEEYQHLFTTGEPYRPELSADFPAKRIEVQQQWQDLALPDQVLTQLQQIKDWMHHGQTLMEEWGMQGKIRPGYRALLYGPPGTGKTMTVGLLGQSCGCDVYQIDLSMVVSKYIGETEKNLEKVFSLAEHKSWILFFDEADALFGKRIEASGANDQFANQNVSYLLQRIERFNGIVLLASNFKDNFDSAFFRRFESVIYIPMPDATLRLKIWQQGFSTHARLASDVDLNAIAKQYPLSGGAISNVIRYVSMLTLSKGGNEIANADLLEGIWREQMSCRASNDVRDDSQLEIFS